MASRRDDPGGGKTAENETHDDGARVSSGGNGEAVIGDNTNDVRRRTPLPKTINGEVTTPNTAEEMETNDAPNTSTHQHKTSYSGALRQQQAKPPQQQQQQPQPKRSNIPQTDDARPENRTAFVFMDNLNNVRPPGWQAMIKSLGQQDPNFLQELEAAQYIDGGRIFEILFRKSDAAATLIANGLYIQSLRRQFNVSPTPAPTTNVSVIGAPLTMKIDDILDIVRPHGQVVDRADIVRKVDNLRIKDGIRLIKFARLDKPIPKTMQIGGRDCQVIYREQDKQLAELKQQQREEEAARRKEEKERRQREKEEAEQRQREQEELYAEEERRKKEREEEQEQTRLQHLQEQKEMEQEEARQQEEQQNRNPPPAENLDPSPSVEQQPFLQQHQDANTTPATPGDPPPSTPDDTSTGDGTQDLIYPPTPADVDMIEASQYRKRPTDGRASDNEIVMKKSAPIPEKPAGGGSDEFEDEDEDHGLLPTPTKEERERVQEQVTQCLRNKTLHSMTWNSGLLYQILLSLFPGGDDGTMIAELHLVIRCIPDFRMSAEELSKVTAYYYRLRVGEERCDEINNSDYDESTKSFVTCWEQTGSYCEEQVDRVVEGGEDFIKHCGHTYFTPKY